MMTEEQKYGLALVATQEIWREAQRSAIGLNKYPLGIDDKLYSLTKPGLYFTESSFDDVANKYILHALSAISFDYALDENADGTTKFKMIHEREQNFMLRFIPSYNAGKFIHMDREWDIDGLIDHLMNWVAGSRDDV